MKNPDERATATELLQHEFIGLAKPASILSQMIAEAREIRENLVYRLTEKHLVDSVDCHFCFIFLCTEMDFIF